MSFLDDIGDAIGGAVDWLGKSSVGSLLGNVAGTALAGYALNQITKSINPENSTPDTAQEQNAATPDLGVRLQIQPSTENKIPVVYGTALIGGKITDAAISDDNSEMFFCLTLCERTGKLNLGTGDDSTINFKAIFWNDKKIFFKGDGYTADYCEDQDGNKDTNIDGLIKVWCYNGSSYEPVSPLGYGQHNLHAYTVFPNWTTEHWMADLVFAIVRIKYNKEHGITGLGTFKFQLENDMKQPGDCLYDYMTNVRYGAGMVPEEISVQ